MDRINDPTAAMDLFGAGKHGFTDGDPGGGIDPTFLNAEWFNGFQENPIRLIEAVGLALAAGDHTQLTKAVKRVAGGNVTGLAASTSLAADHAGVVYVSAASGNLTLTLPLANAAGGVPLPLTLIRTDASANTLTVQRAGADLIDGAASLTVLAGQRLCLVSNGADLWSVLSPLGGLQFGLGVAFAGGGGAAGFSGTWLVPARVTRIFGRCWGAGAGGGGSAFNSAGGGGGGGGYAEGWYQVAPGTTLTIQAGTGGAAGGVSANGTNGTGSFISAPSGPVTGTLLSAGGGMGGGGAAGAAVGAAGVGGTSSGGTFQPAGGAGQAGQLIGSVYLGGLGGAAPLAGGVGYPGATGSIFGAGGGGGRDNAVAPGQGAGGLVTITW